MKKRNYNALLLLLVILITLQVNGQSTEPAKHEKYGKSKSHIEKTSREQNNDSQRLEKIKHLNDIADFIAGIPASHRSYLNPYIETPEWEAYHKESAHAWEQFFNESKKMENWRDKDFQSAKEPINTLFYPFGGPDYLFANIFFPNAKNYILMGLESPGSVPQFKGIIKDSLKSVLNLYKASIEDVMHLSFFRTVDMKTNLTRKVLDGTTPVIMLFLARSGKIILDVQPMIVTPRGGFMPVSSRHKHNAVRIDFRNRTDTVIHHVYYLSANLADPSLSKNKPFLAFLHQLDPDCTSFIKSATYLMHKSYFSIIRNIVLKKSQIILQDDSGIAYKYFDHTLWDITLYGTYSKPINMFKEHFEPDLFTAYQKVSKPLDFRYGYSHKSNLLLARRKPVHKRLR